MISYFVVCLVETTLAASVAILIVGLLRRPLRRALGARAAYWVWLLVPCSTLAVALPAPSQPARAVISAVPYPVTHVVENAAKVFSRAEASSGSELMVLLSWLAGVSAMLTIAVWRQRNFVRSLGRLSSRADGTYGSESGVEPMLLGLWRPRIVLPADFEARYTPEEASLVLAHERAHLQRGDVPVNAIAVAWLCLAWFNPLMYLAVGWLRFDQDLATDALVLEAAKAPRRRYANTLLKTQLISDSPWRLPIGCQWQSGHPLKERIGMLGRPLPGVFRRTVGVSLALAFSALTGCAVWGTQPTGKLGGSGTPVTVHMKWLLNGVDLLPVDGHSPMREFVVSDGVDFDRSYSSAGHVQRIRCVVSLPDTQHASRIWNVPGTWQKFKQTGGPTAGLLLLECIWRENGKVVMTPSVVFPDGGPAAVEVGDGVTDRRLEFKASTSRTRILHPAKASAQPSPASISASRVCPDGALSCEPVAGQLVPVALHERPRLPDR